MARKSVGTRRATDKQERHAALPPTAALVAPMAQVSPHLLDLAEELGRLLARRELAGQRNRRGFSLPELLLGASAMAIVWLLVARALGWLVP